MLSEERIGGMVGSCGDERLFVILWRSQMLVELRVWMKLWKCARLALRIELEKERCSSLSSICFSWE